MLVRVSKIRMQLQKSRNRRESPFLDTKILVSWNGMMIKTLTEASRIIGDQHYLDSAKTAADFLWDNMVVKEGMLRRVLLDGESSINGKLDDYAYFAQALIALYDETGSRIWLDRTQMVVDKMLKLFWDPRNGGLFTVANEDSLGLIARPKDHVDNALPSGNSVAIEVLASMHKRTGLKVYRDRAIQTLDAFAGEYSEFPTSFAYALKAMQDLRHGSAGERDYAANGHIKASLQKTELSSNQLAVDLHLVIEDGWHINSDQPLDKNLIPTAINVSKGLGVSMVNYPNPDLLETQLEIGTMVVFSDTVSIPLKMSRTADTYSTPKVHVTLQACDDIGTCLLPETIVLEIPSAVGLLQ